MTPTKDGRPTRVARELEPRELTDAREMRALAHPVRVALLEALTREGPLTATEASELLDESPANCSFHLRTLAKYGFVEEAEGGDGRSRPWRRVALGQSFREDQVDPDASVAAGTLAEMASDRVHRRQRAWLAKRHAFDPTWRSAAFATDILTYLTPEELEDLGEQVLALVAGYRERSIDLAARPKGAGPVALTFLGHPLPPTTSGN